MACHIDRPCRTSAHLARSNRNRNLAIFLYSATLLPTQALPFFDVGWSQHEIAFYALTEMIVSLGGVSGLVAFLVASTIVVHAIDLVPIVPCYPSRRILSRILAFLSAPRLRRIGVIAPLLLGLVWHGSS